METQYYKNYSPSLERDMECKIWGHGGKPVVFIPCMGGRFFDFENFKMADHWAPWIDAGQVIVCGIDTIDKETYAAHGDPHERILRHEKWIKYITEELAPFFKKIVREQNGGKDPGGMMAFGCSMGGTHSANLYFRFPFLFDSMLSLSGMFSSKFAFGDYSDNLVYLNSPVDYLPNMAPDHPYLAQYRKQRGVICCGQGAWEYPETVWQMKDICAKMDIPVWVDPWGFDVNHDWPWWFKQSEYYLPFLLGDEEWPLELEGEDGDDSEE